MSEFGGDGSGAGESGTFASPLPASGQAAIPVPQGPVTLLSKIAGIIMVLLGLASTPGGAGDPLVYSVLAYSVEGTGVSGELLEIGFCVIGVPELLGGIGILRGKNWGRMIGITYGVLIGVWSLASADSIGSGVIPETDIAGGPILWLILVLSAYSAIVLIFRWRRPATA